ncbi:MAG: hypothetical protein HYT98_01965 [Candidatus Sungbacteria bacterium]|nr:hypothetical protein [Candidatus Sungbacteria bacterium]
MRKILLIFALLLVAPPLANARPVKFGFFYTTGALKEFGNQGGIEIRVHDAVWRTAKEFDIAISISFIKPLPFLPPLITPESKDIFPASEKKSGIESYPFLSMLDAQLVNIQNADYIFTVTSEVLWYQDLTEENTLRFKQLDGLTRNHRNPGKHAILKDFKNRGREYFTEILWHEWGHMLGLKHWDKQTCFTIHFLMCNHAPLTQPLIIEKSFRDAVRATAQMFEKQRD